MGLRVEGFGADPGEGEEDVLEAEVGPASRGERVRDQEPQCAQPVVQLQGRKGELAVVVQLLECALAAVVQLSGGS